MTTKDPEAHNPLCIRRIFPPTDGGREGDQDDDDEDFLFISFSSSIGDGILLDDSFDEELKYHSKREVPQQRLIVNTVSRLIANRWNTKLKLSFLFITLILFYGRGFMLQKGPQADYHDNPRGVASNVDYGTKPRYSSITKIQQSRDLDLSIVILVGTKYELLAKLLSSIIDQKWTTFEVIVVDRKCHPVTKRILRLAFEDISFRYKYLPLCNNPSYAIGSNKGAEAVSDHSKWIMFLHDDVVLQDKDFLKNMVDIGTKGPNVGGAVCTLLSQDREELIEAGGIVWNDGYAESVGRGEAFESLHHLAYSKPVDFGSGACLMLEKQLFVGAGGFEANDDNNFFTDYYIDIDLQLRIQHQMGKEIWLQPKATAIQVNPNHDSRTASNAAQHFVEQWGDQLISRHLQNPRKLDDHRAKRLQIMKAGDLRARNSSTANILWFEGVAPNPENGSEFERAFEIMSVAAELGHKITLVLEEKLRASWCDKICRDRIASLGVELFVGPWEEYVDEYFDFFDIVYVRKSATFQRTFEKWQEVYEKHPFALIYDCETLWYERDWKLVSLLQRNNIYNFPGGMEHLSLTGTGMDMELVKLEIENAKYRELNLIRMADSVITASYRETEKIRQYLPDTQIFTARHTISVDEARIGKKAFHQRSGILFSASFNDSMYHNGDAILYFLNEVYPLVLKESKSPISLTIVGRNIPEELYELVERKNLLKRNVIFRESVVDIDELYNDARILIAPNLYGAGIQYKVCEAFSLGVPTVMSTFTAESIGINARDDIGCIGYNAEALKKCIMNTYNDEEAWDKMQQNGFKFIRKNYNRNDTRTIMDRAINTNLLKIKSTIGEGDTRKIEHGLITTRTVSPEVTEPCPEGEKYYAFKNMDVKKAVSDGKFESFFQHYQLYGKRRGKEYLCKRDITSS